MFSKTPPKGMRDFLPADFALRQKVLNVITSTYASFGFSAIETPSVENLALLCSKQGGDNEKLIYKILKRGEKLEKADGGELCDLGLRFDLTIPLSRFYSANVGKLPSVFKSMQCGYVWRADRPQKGRYRQFMQCDIDVIGEPTILAETELITATTEALYKLGFNDTLVKVNDRRLLRAIAIKCGFAEEDHEKVYIALDKLDKIGVNGVLDEINAFAPDKSESFVNLLMQITASSNPLQNCFDALGEYLSDEVKESLSGILDVCKESSKANVVFDVTLVRGMNYYTGSIFEISLSGLDISVAGGGRYDKLIGKISGTNAPACGFSIGFERIVYLLSEKQALSFESNKIAVLIPKDADKETIIDVYKVASNLRKKNTVSVIKKIKNFGHQLEGLKADGFVAIYTFADGKLSKVE